MANALLLSERDPDALATLAMAVQHKLLSDSAGLDPVHLGQLLESRPWLGLAGQVCAPAVTWVGAVSSLWGGLPPLQSFFQLAAGLALLPREPLLRSLCTLALARRPGVVRGLIERASRDGVRAAVGPAWPALQALSAKSLCAAGPQRCLDPGPLAWVGYEDWSLVMRQGPPQLLRMVWHSLPPDDMAQGTDLASALPSHWSGEAAIEHLDAMGFAWPC